MNERASTLLICTVGGSPEPVVAAIRQWRPLRVCFVHTPQTKGDIEAKIIVRAREEGIDLDAGRYDLFELPDGQDLAPFRTDGVFIEAPMERGLRHARWRRCSRAARGF